MTHFAVFSEVQKNQLESCLFKIQSCTLFRTAPRQYRFLKYLLDHTITDKNNRLKGYTIAVEVFDRPADFDPGIDSIVRVEAGKLRAKLREYYEDHGQQDEVRFMLPKGSYCLEVSYHKNPTHSPLQQPANLEFIERRKHSAQGLIAARPTLAILPFINLTSLPEENNYLVDGLVDSLIFLMSRLNNILVVSRQSSFCYRASTASATQIGAELGVRYLVEGAVQQTNNYLRVTVNLIDTSVGGHIWSDRYESTLNDIFDVQDKLALSITKALKVKISGEESVLFGQEETTNYPAFDAVLRGLECHWKYSPKSIAEARNYFIRAIEHDSSYAAAHAWLARSILHQWIMKWDEAPGLRELAMQHAQQAVTLRPQLPYALSILGWVSLWSKQREASIHYCRQAVVLDANNPELLNFLAMALSSAGLGEEALFYIEKALRLNPHSSPFYQFVLGQTYFVLEENDKAIAAFQHGCEMSETFIPNHVYLCATYAHLGMHEEMRAKRQVVISLTGGIKTKMIELPWTAKKWQDLYDSLMEKTDLRE